MPFYGPFSRIDRSVRLGLQRYWDLPHDSGFRSRLLSVLLTPPSLLYGFGQRLRRWLYRRGILPQRSLPLPVVSIGGLRVGGVGKTPFTQWLAEGLGDRGLRAAILTRGYGRKGGKGTQVLVRSELERWRPEECGDEPYQLAGALPDVPVVVNADRYSAAKFLMASRAVDVFLLDDGFQHLQLARNVDVVLIPGSNRFAACFPKGPFREPASALKDAHLLVRTGVGVTVSQVGSSMVPAPGPSEAGLPEFRVRFEPGDVFTVGEQRFVEPDVLRGARIFAFCGVARPSLFWSTLEAKGLSIASRMTFPDHCPYSKGDYERILQEMSGMDWALTTEKDAAKIARFPWPRDNVLFIRLNTVMEREETFWQELRDRGVLKHG